MGFQGEAYLACAIVRPGDELVPRLVEGAVRQGQDVGPQYLFRYPTSVSTQGMHNITVGLVGKNHLLAVEHPDIPGAGQSFHGVSGHQRSLAQHEA